jgi:hypothetical protein
VPYFIAFDISQKPFAWWFSAIGLFFVAVGIVLIKYGRVLHRRPHDCRASLHAVHSELAFKILA